MSSERFSKVMSIRMVVRKCDVTFIKLDIISSGGGTRSKKMSHFTLFSYHESERDLNKRCFSALLISCRCG